MGKSRWKDMTEEQRAHHREMEKTRRARRKANRTPEQVAALSERRKEERHRRQNKPSARAVAKEYKRSGKGWFYSWANAIKQRALKKGLPFDLDADYLQSIYTGVCPVFGVELQRRHARDDNSALSPTVDRIVPELGYVKGNVIIVSRRANNIKSDATVYEILQVAE